MIMDDIDNLKMGNKIRWGKIWFCCFSLIFMAAAGIGMASVVMGANKSQETNDDDGSSSDSISVICAETDYKEECISGLSAAVLYDSSVGHPMELIKTTFGLTGFELEKAFNLSASTPRNSSNNSLKFQSITDCQQLLQCAMDELRDCMNRVTSIGLKGLPDRKDELRNSLGAALSYEHSCVDGLSDNQTKTEIENGVNKAAKLTSNALAIVTEINSILTNLHIDLKSSRRLSDDVEPIPNNLHHPMGRTEYPSWFEATDRKLLALHDSGKVIPNAVVAKDGSGQFKTISKALEAIPSQYEGRYVIYVKAGVYQEQVTVTKKMTNVMMYGDGPRKTIVTGDRNFVDGTTTYQAATFAAIGKGFIAKSMGFQNTAGAGKSQAVALRVQSDQSAFFNCLIDGFQNTLHVLAHRQFYQSCVISGTIDIIFGDAAAFLQNSTIFVKRPLGHQQNTITAQARNDKRSPTGTIIQNCQIIPHLKHSPVRSKTRTYLGRPSKQYSRSVVMESYIGELIDPQGWIPSPGIVLDTIVFSEYGNKGPSADTSKRVRWGGYKVITNRSEALQYTTGNFLQGELWLKRVGIPTESNKQQVSRRRGSTHELEAMTSTAGFVQPLFRAKRKMFTPYADLKSLRP